MEKRPLFILGDLFANALVATAATALTSVLIGGTWGMLPGMLVGMLLGMLIVFPLGLGLLSPLLGAMEVISPCMLSGMLGGMWGGMMTLSGNQVVFWGIGTGVCVVAMIYLLNAIVTGPQNLRHKG